MALAVGWQKSLFAHISGGSHDEVNCFRPDRHDLLWNPALALADEASKTAKIEEMMQITNMDRMTTQMIDQVRTMRSSQFGSMPAEARQSADEMQKKVMKLLADRLNWDKAKPAYIKLYAETFTESEIDGIVGFYKSPPGQAMLSKMPVLMQNQ